MTSLVTQQNEGCAPLLRWAGSKRQLRAELARYWKPSFTRYVEPFAGSCSLFFWLSPERALLTDKNHELIDVYRVLSRHPEELHSVVSSFPRGRAAYNELRSKSPGDLSAMRRAARFVFLNRYCFNGIYRTNREGRFNVPFSAAKTGRVPSVQSFRACADLLQRAVLRAADFGTTLRHVQAGDFVYLDPPYATTTRRVFTEYGPRPFGREDLERLQSHLHKLDARGAAFVLSYADCPELRAAKSAWNVRIVTVRRNVAGFRSHRRRARELIVSNIDLE
jgi:DNA adenine methylase